MDTRLDYYLIVSRGGRVCYGMEWNGVDRGSWWGRPSVCVCTYRLSGR